MPVFLAVAFIMGFLLGSDFQKSYVCKTHICIPTETP